MSTTGSLRQLARGDDIGLEGLAHIEREGEKGLWLTLVLCR